MSAPRATIRPARTGDVPALRRLIGELAAYEGLAEAVRASEADLRRDGFGERPRFEALLAEAGGEAVGFALFFPTYSTFEGRPGLWLEDLYVAEPARGGGLGRRLVARVARLAVERGCRRLDLAALEWNPARRVFARLGFRHTPEWQGYRLDGEALAALAARAED